MYRVFGEVFPASVVFVALGVIAFCLLTLKLRTVLLLTLIALFLPSMRITYLSGASRLLRWAFLAGLVGKGLLLNFRMGFRPNPVTREHRTILVLAFLMLLSALWSIGPEITLVQGATLILIWVGVFLVLWNSWSEEGGVVGLCNVLFLLAALVFCTEGLYHLLHWGSGFGRYAGAFSNPNALGTAVAFLSPFVYWKHRTTAAPVVRILTRGLGLIMVVDLFLSGSRSGILGTLVCMGIMLAYVHRARLALTLAAVLPPLLLLIILAPRLETGVMAESDISTRIIRADTIENLSDRLPMWEEGFGYFLERPILGWGFGMNKFIAYGRADFDLERAIVKLGDKNYHTTHLQLAMDLGVVGLVVFWVFLVSVLRRGFAVFRRKEHGELELAGMAYFGAYLALVGDSVVHGWVFSPGSSMSIVFWLVSAAVIRVHVLVLQRDADEEAERREAGALAEEQTRLSPLGV